MRFKYLDVLRAIAILGVVVIHAAVPLVTNSTVGTFDWWTGHVYDSLFRISVPLFFMVSGALLLSKKNESLKTFYFKRFLPLLLTFIVWSTIYFIDRNISRTESFTFRNYMKSLIAGDIHNRLWFLYTILGIYLVTPFLRTFVINASRVELKTYLFLWFIGTTSAGFLNHFYNIETRLDLTILYGYVGYFILGYFLHTYNFSINVRIITMLFLFLNVSTIIGTFYLSSINQENNLYLYKYLSPNIMIMSASIFIIAKQLIKGEPSTALKKISVNSFGIYVIHTFVMNNMRNYGISHNMFNPIIAVPLVIFLTFILSLFLSEIIKKIPILKYITP